MTSDKQADDQLMKQLERAITAVLKNPKATRRDKIQAIEAGTKLLLVKHKMTGTGDDGQFFGS